MDIRIPIFPCDLNEFLFPIGGSNLKLKFGVKFLMFVFILGN